MSVLEALKGNVIDGSGKAVDIAAFVGEGTVFGLYFSAHWCPPCRKFTPALAAFHQMFKKDKPDKQFEIIFVSSDRNENDFKSYYSTMPWLALRYECRQTKDTLSRKFKVTGIPALILFNGADGSVINTSARSIVFDDPQGKLYPWKPPTYSGLIKGNLIKSDKTSVESTSIKGKVKLLYFSAHWCPPCKAFTPNLVTFYNKLKKTNDNFEVIFITSDRDDDSFKEYLSTMPWLAIPFGDGRIGQLESLFEISGIPSLIVLDENDKVITESGRSMVDYDPEAKLFPWRPQPIEPLDSSAAANTVNNETCVVYFTDGTDDGIGQAKAAMKDIAREQLAKGDEQELYFLYATGKGIAQDFKEFIGHKQDHPSLVIVSVPDRRMYVCDKENLSKDIVESFIRDYLAGNLTALYFGQ
ncbi:nucleoredoxin-like [Tubulanus polymorphus]|uniref:nucleoredoxin-like n=1 Tax=Tubulanus polymorphus TaxID=672921 RepID=UPI003DA3E2BD